MKKWEELFDRFKKLVEEQPNPKTEPATQEDAEDNALSEKRKRALVHYLAVLFGAAFLVVGISLVATWHSSRSEINALSNSASSALSKVEALQANNLRLLQEKEALSQEKKALLEENARLQEVLKAQGYDAQEYLEVAAQEYLEATAQEYMELARTEALLEKDRVTAAYEFLLQAIQAFQHRDRPAYDTAMERLDPLWVLLDTVGQEEYLTLLDTPWEAAQ